MYINDTKSSIIYIFIVLYSLKLVPKNLKRRKTNIEIFKSESGYWN